MTNRAETESRPFLYSTAIVVAIMIGVLIGAVNADQNQEAYSGDYPAFYGAGTIAASGEWEALYDLDRQIEAQRELHAADKDEARFFAYPPQVAFAYQPLAALGFLQSFLLHTVLMGLLLWVSLLLARPMIPWLRGRVAVGMAAALIFWPMFRTVTGGSNTALTVFLIIAGWRLVHDDRHLAGGIVLSGLLFKPQFAVPLIGLFLLRRYWKVVLGAGLGTVAFYLCGVALRGWSWVAEWIDAAGDFGRIDAELNGHSAISFIGFAENQFGVGMSVPVAVAWGLAAATALLLSWLWFRSPGVDLDRLIAITMPGILLLSLHAMSHDGAVIVITAAIACGLWARSNWLPWVVGIWVLGASAAFIKQIGWSPGFVMLLLALWLGWRLVALPKT